MMSKELDGKMKKLMEKSKRDWEIAEKKRKEEELKNDPLAGRSLEFRKLVSYALMGRLFTDGQTNKAKDSYGTRS